VLELIRGLSRIAPQAEFILLTQAASHEELANLDGKNVRRMMVAGQQDLVDGQAFARRLNLNWVYRLFTFVKRRLIQGACKVCREFKYEDGRHVLLKVGVDLLFCPFTAPTFFKQGIPTVCTIYDLQFATYPQFFEPEDLAHRKNVFLNACQKATLLVAISDYSRVSALAYGKLAPNQNHRVANGATYAVCQM